MLAAVGLGMSDVQAMSSTMPDCVSLAMS